MAEFRNFTQKSNEAVDFDIQTFIDGVVCIMVDEVHKAKADVLKTLLSSVFANAPIRWGLTGTISKIQHEAVACTSTIGPITNLVQRNYKTKECYLT